MKKYKNGSTREIVYQTTECQEEIGYLNPYEECDCYGITNGLAIVCYKIDGSLICKMVRRGKIKDCARLV